MQQETLVSERRACFLVGLSRTVLHYESKARIENERLQERISKIAGERHRFGYRRIHALLRREGVTANHKRVFRLYQEAGLAVRRRRKRHGIAVEREHLALPDQPNEVWSMDFVSDALSSGRRIRALTIVDDFTRESIDIVVDHSISGHYVTRVLDQAVRFRGRPTAIRTDQGPEFTGKALDQWAYRNGHRTGQTDTECLYIESFNGKFRDECLNEHWFTSLAAARVLISAWWRDCNEYRPHSALNYQTPAEFAARRRKSLHNDASQQEII